MADMTKPPASESYAFMALYRDDVHGSTSFEVIGGPKAYLRRWDSGKVEWSWVLADTAVLTDEPTGRVTLNGQVLLEEDDDA